MDQAKSLFALFFFLTNTAIAETAILCGDVEKLRDTDVGAVLHLVFDNEYVKNRKVS